MRSRTSVTTYRYNNKTYKIDDIDFNSSPKDTFVNEKGETISFIDYYRNQYGITITDPGQPMLVHRPQKKAVTEGETEKLICLVPELCMMTGMTEQMRADFKIMTEVAKFTRVTPEGRCHAMKNFVARINECPDALRILADWGIKLAPHPFNSSGRVLEPPVLHFGHGQKEMLTRSDWSRAATNKPVLTPISLTNWVVLFPQDKANDVRRFCQTMQNLAQRMGITMAQPRPIKLANDRTNAYVDAMREAITPDLQLALAVVPQQRSDRYDAIKKLCYVEKPVASQIVLLKNITNEKKMSSVAAKIVLQMNCKLGGELWSAQPRNGPLEDLMVVGIDVHHDRSRKSPSMAGVVVSLNGGLSRWFSTVAAQKQGQEISDALLVAFMDALFRYWETNHSWPAHIVVFRDGVADSQMEMVRNHEVKQFLNAIRRMDVPESVVDPAKAQMLRQILPENYDPGFNFVVVQKRINTRVFGFTPGSPNPLSNPPAGTVLDHTVTRRHFKDFFLVPQSVNQGTVTPTHFVVLDASGSHPLEADAVQRLTYLLTHMYFNWPGTVRVPAPCQYAHKMVDMAGAHLHNLPSQDLYDKLYFL